MSDLTIDGRFEAEDARRHPEEFPCRAKVQGYEKGPPRSSDGVHSVEDEIIGVNIAEIESKIIIVFST